MALKLTIENFSTLPNGGPLSYTMKGQNYADIGRDQHLDWSLPDENRYISGKHCEIRRESDAYLLIDVSTNGTYLNGASARMQSPYRLKDGDRLQIGEYIIAVCVVPETGEAATQDAPAPRIDRPASYDSIWESGESAAPPIDPRALRPQRAASPAYGDFLYRAADVPRVNDPEQFSPADPDMLWARATPAPVVETPAPRAPEPRRPTRAAIWDDDLRPDQRPEGPPQPNAAAAPSPPPRAADLASASFLDAFARASGVPRETLQGRSADELGETLGRAMLSVTENMQQLLHARAQAKQLARSAEHTTIRAQENNPLKFSPSPQDALRIMLGPPSSSYLDADRAIAGAFADLKKHQVQTYSAMQQALCELIAELDPAKIEATVPQASALGAVVKSRRGALWDAYVAAWARRAREHPDGVVGRFMTIFGRFYDQAGGRT